MQVDSSRAGRQAARRPSGSVIMLALLAAMTFSLWAAGVAAAAASSAPAATTSAASSVTSTSATLNGIVGPNKNPTTYVFQYGTSSSPYSNQTPVQGPVNGNGGKAVSTGVTALTPDSTYHIRIVATNSAGTTSGSDLTFKTPGAGTSSDALTISSRPAVVTYDTKTTIAGQLDGPGNGGVSVTLEEDPYPYTGAFKRTGIRATTTATGAYSLAVAPTLNTRYRVTAKTGPPVMSTTVTVSVRVRVSLRVSRRTLTFGQLVRFYGTVAPAHDGKIAQIQRRTTTGGWATVARTALVSSTPVNGVPVSVFSTQLRLRRNGTYRALVRPGDGDHLANTSVRIAERVRVRVTLTLKPAGGHFVRFSGTVTPAHNGRIARIQKRTSTGGWTTVSSTTLVAGATVNGIPTSRFSARLLIRHSATYRVLLSPRDSDHITGTSPARTVLAR